MKTNFLKSIAPDCLCPWRCVKLIPTDVHRTAEHFQCLNWTHLSQRLFFLSDAESTKGWKCSALYRAENQNAHLRALIQSLAACAQGWLWSVAAVLHCKRVVWKTSPSGDTALTHAWAVLQLCLAVNSNDPDLITLAVFLAWLQACLIPKGLPDALCGWPCLCSVTRPTLFCVFSCLACLASHFQTLDFFSVKCSIFLLLLEEVRVWLRLLFQMCCLLMTACQTKGSFLA